MTCGQAEEYLYFFREGELEAREADLLKAHLQECESCREIAAELSRMHDILKGEIVSISLFEGERQARQKIYSLTVDRPVSSRHHFHSGQLLVHPVVRLGSAALIAGFVVLFLLQNFLYFRSIQQLERRYTVSAAYAQEVSVKPGMPSDRDMQLLKSVINKLGNRRLSRMGLHPLPVKLFLLEVRNYKHTREFIGMAPDIDSYWIYLLKQSHYSETIELIKMQEEKK